MTFVSRAVRTLSSPGFGRRIVLLITAGFGLVLAINLVSLFAADAMGQQSRQIAHTYEVRERTLAILTATLQAEAAQRGYLLTGVSSEATLSRRRSAEALEALDALRARMAEDPAQQARIDALRPILHERIGLLEQHVRYVRDGRRRDVIAAIQTGHGFRLMAQVRERLAEISAVEQRRLVERQRAARWAEQVAFWANSAGTVVVLLLGLLSVSMTVRHVGMLATARDALQTLNARLEDRVRERTRALTEANEEVQRFAYIVSHDLRAPLVNVMGYTVELERAASVVEAQFARLEAEAPASLDPAAAAAVREDMPEALGFIRTSTAKMDRLIGAILKLSREGRRRLAPVELDMTTLVGGLADTLRYQVESQGGEIIVADLPPLVTDRLLIEQVFGNILDNAVKYLKPGRPGRITVTGTVEPDGQHAYEIADNGRGIDPKDHARIFELFRRAGRQDRPGEGLGLAFVKSSVQRLGGQLKVRSVPGHGSTFRLVLPAITHVSEEPES